MRWISAVAVLVLAGCSAISSIPTHSQTATTAIQESGGRFNATYSGTSKRSRCGGAPGYFDFSGSGMGSFIQSSTEVGSMTSGSGNCEWNGTATFTSSLHPRNSITVALFLSTSGLGNVPCHPRLNNIVKFTVASGTGRFADATGRGTVVFHCHINGNYSDDWAGSISF
jgi:hypothetical protein